jgi:short-subunit dehydrogenase
MQGAAMTPSRNSLAGRRYWLVGASAGLGHAIARKLADEGASLVLSARNAAELQALAGQLSTECMVAPCDVQDRSSVEAAIRAAPPIHGVIFCAGVYDPLRAQDWDAEKIETMCDVNFTGCARVLGAALPSLLDQGHGHIVLIGSLAGLRGLPGSQGYGASKAGVIHMAQQLRVDLPSDRFTVQLMNPGFIRTRLTDKNAFPMPFLMSPENAAHRIVQAMHTRRFSTCFPGRFAALFHLIGLLPDILYTPIARRMTG